MADYIVGKDGWIAGRLRRAGDTVALSERAAKYEHVRLAQDAAPAPATTAAPKRGGKGGA